MEDVVDPTQAQKQKQLRTVFIIAFVAGVIMTVVDLIGSARGHPQPLHTWATRAGWICATGGPLTIKPLRLPLLVLAVVCIAVWLVASIKGV